MIFQTELFEIDLSSNSVSLKEENDLFTDSINRNYSLPFTIEADAELLVKLGFPTTDNVTDFEITIEGKLLLPYDHYPATLNLGDIQNNRIECSLTWGRDDLPVFDLHLRDLQWGFVINPDMRAQAQSVITKEWPEVGYQFPMIYRPQQAAESNYEAFEMFMNHHDGSGFLNNTTVDQVHYNRNILAPAPYALEILKKVFTSAGKKIFGSIWSHPVLTKICYVPEKHLENFRGTSYQTFNFGLPTSVEEDVFGLKNYYRKVFNMQQIGTHVFQYKIEMDPVLAESFYFRVFLKNNFTEEETDLLVEQSQLNFVNLQDELKVNIDATNQGSELNIEMKIKYTQQNISATNSFEYTFDDGKLNQFSSVFSLRDFIPDMTAGEYVNMLKNWWNLDIDYKDDHVYVNFAKDSVFDKPKADHSHLEDPQRKKRSNKNRLYKLTYDNGEVVYYNRTGRLSSVRNEKNFDLIEIEMPLKPLEVESSEGVITAVFPEDTSDFDFVVYDGVNPAGQPLCSSSLTNDMKLNCVVENWWERWLYFRVHSFSSSEDFECSVHEQIKKEELSVKYNELHIIKTISKKYLSEKRMRVEIESETF